MPDVQTLMTGLAFGESPRWHEDRLWFSNWGMHSQLDRVCASRDRNRVGSSNPRACGRCRGADSETGRR